MLTYNPMFIAANARAARERAIFVASHQGPGTEGYSGTKLRHGMMLSYGGFLAIKLPVISIQRLNITVHKPVLYTFYQND